MTRRGVYFLANDGILDIAIAFLNSFRCYNPSIELCLIPFSDDIERLRLLGPQYRFSIWRDVAALQWCDGIGRLFHGCTVGQYRKLAMWEGVFDEFVYIDCDTVVLHNIEFAFHYLARCEYLASHSDIPDIRRWVWKTSVYASGALSSKQISYAANTGFVASKRMCMSRAHVEARLDGALALAPHMELFCCEQPLINYLIVTSGQRYTSLYAIARESGGWFGIPRELWAGDPSFVVREGRVVRPKTAVLMVHWAGEWEIARREGRQIPHHDLWSYYRHLSPPLMSNY